MKIINLLKMNIIFLYYKVVFCEFHEGAGAIPKKINLL